MKEHEKLIAFILLLAVICFLSWMFKGQQTFVMVDGKPVTVNDASVMTGLISALSTVLGMAGQALFRTSETAGQMNDLLKDMADKLGKSVPHDPNGSQPPSKDEA